MAGCAAMVGRSVELELVVAGYDADTRNASAQVQRYCVAVLSRGILGRYYSTVAGEETIGGARRGEDSFKAVRL